MFRQPLWWRRAVLPIRPGEGKRVGLSVLYFFCLLSAYYVLRPVRDEMSVRAGVGKMPWFFTGTFIAMLALVPVFGYVSSRCPRRRFLPGILIFFAGNLVVFFIALRPPALSPWAAPAFFVWLAVFNLLAVSVSWSFVSDLFQHEQSRRLFGIVAAGASLGAILGPAATALAAPRVGPGRLLLGAAALLVVCALAANALGRNGPDGEPEAGEDPLGGGSLDGVGLTVRSPFLLAVALALVCYTMVSTVLYFAQTEIVGASIRSAGDRTALFAKIDLAVNALTVLLQVFVTGPLIRRAGVGGALAAVAAAATAGAVFLGIAPELVTVVALQIVHRAGHFAVGRPARETLFVALDAETRYKAKGFIDTAVYRGSDAASAWLLALLQSHGAGVAATAWLSVPVGMVWTATSYWLGRKGDLGQAGLSRCQRTLPGHRSAA